MLNVIFISGASRGIGIGRALAHSYAKPDVHLILLARNALKLQEVCEECQNLLTYDCYFDLLMLFVRHKWMYLVLKYNA